MFQSITGAGPSDSVCVKFLGSSEDVWVLGGQVVLLLHSWVLALSALRTGSAGHQQASVVVVLKFAHNGTLSQKVQLHLVSCLTIVESYLDTASALANALQVVHIALGVDHVLAATNLLDLLLAHVCGQIA